MLISHLLYGSHAAHGLRDSDIVKILEVSRRNNFESGLTGLLLFRQHKFLQLLEGEETAVLRAFKRISTDDRHFDARVLTHFNSENRIFPQWHMGYPEKAAAKKVGKDVFVTIERMLNTGEIDRDVLITALGLFNAG